MMMTAENEQVQSLTEFKIVEKPQVENQRAFKGRYNKLLEALSNLANGKAIIFNRTEIAEPGEKKMKTFRTYIHTLGKKRGLNVGVYEKAGNVYIFNR